MYWCCSVRIREITVSCEDITHASERDDVLIMFPSSPPALYRCTARSRIGERGSPRRREGKRKDEVAMARLEDQLSFRPKVYERSSSLQQTGQKQSASGGRRIDVRAHFTLGLFPIYWSLRANQRYLWWKQVNPVSARGSPCRRFDAVRPK